MVNYKKKIVQVISTVKKKKKIYGILTSLHHKLSSINVLLKDHAERHHKKRGKIRGQANAQKDNVFPQRQ